MRGWGRSSRSTRRCWRRTWRNSTGRRRRRSCLASRRRRRSRSESIVTRAARRRSLLLVATLLAMGFARSLPGDPPSPSPSPPASGGEGTALRGFDPVDATRAYLARMTPEKKARSDAYFEGGYWLQLWEFLYAVVVAWLLLWLGWSAWMRNFAERAVRQRALQTFIYWALYATVTALLIFPLTVYRDFYREHAYGLATQTFGPWFGDRLKELAISVILGGVTVVVLYVVLRRAPRTWWIWGSLTATLLLAISFLIAPLVIFPLFNRYTRLQDETLRGPILSLARANGIPARDVFVSDASRQTTRISANVSGLFGSERITLNDNLLKRCSLPEFEAMSRRHGGRWGVRSVADPAGMPVFAILISCYLFVLTPVTNTIIRVQEAEADIFGLNASRQPDGFAEIALKLSEYRKLDPTPLEEFLLYDHPSGRTRIFTAMRWKAEHLKAQP